eukprot:6200987-Pyramimonas_sp.AAC.2
MDIPMNGMGYGTPHVLSSCSARAGGQVVRLFGGTPKSLASLGFPHVEPVQKAQITLAASKDVEP